MARNRLSEVDLTIFPGLFYTTLHYTQFVGNTVYTYTAVYGRRYIAIFAVGGVCALSLYLLYIFRCEVGGDHRIDTFQDLGLVLGKWCAAIAIYTTASLAFVQVTNKLLFYDLIAQEYVVYCYHGYMLI
jgi:hypothetical protein